MLQQQDEGKPSHMQTQRDSSKASAAEATVCTKWRFMSQLKGGCLCKWQQLLPALLSQQQQQQQ